MSNLEQARIFARAGAQALDGIEAFKGWREVIDKEELNMGDGDYCILGQLGIKKLGITPDDHLVYEEVLNKYFDDRMENRLGFNTDYELDIEYKDLQQAWLEILIESE